MRGRYISLFPAVILFAGSLLAVSLMLSRTVTQEACAAPTQSRDVPKNLEGIEIVGSQLKLKPGYEFVKRSANKGAIQRIRGGLNVVEIDCICKSEKGGCDIELIGEIVRCQPSGGCTSCERVTRVPQGLKPGVLR